MDSHLEEQYEDQQSGSFTRDPLDDDDHPTFEGNGEDDPEPTGLQAMDLQDLYEFVGDLRHVLWPKGDVDQEWTPQTLDDVARVFGEYGLLPGQESS